MATSVDDLSERGHWQDVTHNQESSIGDAVPVIYKHLNFKVPPEFHRDFKIWAASHDISMTALLMEAFRKYCNQELK